MPRLHPLGWLPTGVFGALGAAAAAAKLLGLDPKRTATALGLAGSQSAGLIQNLGTMTKPFHAGNAARAGIKAAEAARIHALDEQNRSIAGVTAISRSKSSAWAARSTGCTERSVAAPVLFDRYTVPTVRTATPRTDTIRHGHTDC